MSQTNELLDVLSRIKDSVIGLDNNCTITYVNPAFAGIFGLEPLQMIGRNVWDLLPKVVGTTVYNNVNEAIKTKELRRFEWEGIYSKSYWETTVFPSVNGVTVITKDISTNKKALEALKLSEERYRYLLEYAPTAIYEIDFSGPSFKNANDVMSRLSGYSREELLSMNPLDILLFESRGVFQERIRKVSVGEGISETVEYKVKVKDGRVLSVVLYVKPTYKDGKISGALVVGYDITERKKVEEALKESEELYRSLFDNSEDGFILVEPLHDKKGGISDFLFLKVNVAYESQTGRKASSLEGKTVSEMSEKLEQEWIDTCREVAETRKSTRIESYNKLTGKWFDAHFFPYAKSQVGILFRDISERIKLEKQLQEKERLAAIGATAGMVGHDIRNPLQAIVGDVYLLKLDLVNMRDIDAKASFLESLEGIERNIGYINKIVADLQDFARPLHPEYSFIDLSELVTSIAESIEIPSDIHFKANIANPVLFETDPMFMRRALTNLVNNAIQAMPDGGTLEISSFEDNSNFCIIVSDTGIGIPEEVKPKLFKPMMTTKSKGQGLGLAVVKRLIEALNGKVSFESQKGEGTKFIVRLPKQN